MFHTYHVNRCLEILTTFFNNDDYFNEHDYRIYNYHCIDEYLNRNFKNCDCFSSTFSRIDFDQILKMHGYSNIKTQAK